MSRRILLFTFTVVGITSVITQTLFIRELEQIFYGNELCLGVIFSGWLFFTGLGSIIARRIKKNIFLKLQTALSLILPAEFFLVHSIKPVLNIGPGELISPIPMIFISFTIFAPLALVLGMLFVQGCEWWSGISKSEMQGVSKVYILDAIGDMTGGFLFAYLLIRLFSLTTLFIVGILNLILAFVLSGRDDPCGRLPIHDSRFTIHKFWLRGSILMLTILNILGLGFSGKLERFSMKCDYPKQEVVNYKRSLYGNLALVRTGELSRRDGISAPPQFSLYENGILSFTYPTPLRAEEMVHFPALQVKEVKRILILGGDIELLKEALKYEVELVQWVKLDKKILEVCKPQIDFELLQNPRVQVSWEDGRRFVKKWAGRQFDLVIIDVGEPSTSLANRFYTYEFFDELKRIVHPEGVVSLRISSNLNYLSNELKEYNGTIYKTLEKVFPRIVLVPGDELKLFASAESEWLSDDPDILSLRLRVPTRYVTEHYIPYEFYEERIHWIHNTLDEFTPRTLNRDWHPISYYYNTMVQTSYFSQPFKKVLEGFLRIPGWLMLLVIILIFIGIGSVVQAPVLAIGVLGGSGISAQILLILAFEVLQGYMYHKIGIITGGFMLGVAFGAKWTGVRGQGLGNRSQESDVRKIWHLSSNISHLASIIGGTILYLGILSLICHLSSVICHLKSEWLFYLLPVIGGLLTGCAWTLANRELIRKGETAGRSSGLLNGVDLFGSCAGSFFISVFFVPIYGFHFSLLLLACLNLVALGFLLKKHG